MNELMYYLDHSFPTAEENLAWDEALIEVADRCTELDKARDGAADQHPEDEILDAECQLETLRVWEMLKTCVILGRSSRVHTEVQVEACEADNVPILRRASGGASVVAGPGCLMYSVLLSLTARPGLRDLTSAHQFVMQRTQRAVTHWLQSASLAESTHIRGTCDLTLDDKKISGNALRVKRHWLLYHGTVLVAMSIDGISRYLRTPPKEPAYRDHRPHHEFVTSLESLQSNSMLSIEQLKAGFAKVWQANSDWHNSPLRAETTNEMQNLLSNRYLKSSWNFER